MLLNCIVYVSFDDIIKFIETTENIETIRNLLDKYPGYLVYDDTELDIELSDEFKEILFDNGQRKTTIIENIKNLVDNSDEWNLIFKIGCAADFEITNRCTYESYCEDDIIHGLGECRMEFGEVFRIFKNAQKRYIFEEC